MFHPSLEHLLPAELAAAQEALHARGYHRFEAFAALALIERLEAEIASLAAHLDAPSLLHLVRDQHGKPLVMGRMDKLSDYLFDLARHPILMRLAESLLQRPAISLNIQYIAKFAGSGPPTAAHQDQATYQAHFTTEPAITFWIALDDATIENGALEYGQPSPRRLLDHVLSDTVATYELMSTEGLTFEAAPLPAGGCVVHHALAVRRAGENRTSRPRRAVVFSYRGSAYRAALDAAGAP